MQHLNAPGNHLVAHYSNTCDVKIFFLSVCLSFSVCLLVCLSLSVCLSVLSFCPSAFVFSLFLSGHCLSAPPPPPSLFLCLCPCLSLCLCLSLSVCLSTSVSLCLCLYVSVSVCLCVCLCVCVSVSLYVCLSVCLSVSLSLPSPSLLSLPSLFAAKKTNLRGLVLWKGLKDGGKYQEKIEAIEETTIEAVSPYPRCSET